MWVFCELGLLVVERVYLYYVTRGVGIGRGVFIRGLCSGCLCLCVYRSVVDVWSRRYGLFLCVIFISFSGSFIY